MDGCEVSLSKAVTPWVKSGLQADVGGVQSGVFWRKGWREKLSSYILQGQGMDTWRKID